MAEIKISVINESTVVSDADVEKAIPDLQTQIHRDFNPVWGVDADLTFVGKGKKPPAGTWWLSILDDSDEAGALGYHDLTDEGLPLAKVFAGTDIVYHSEWTVTASHELVEMLGDPDINLYAFVQTGGNSGIFYSYEVCDPCELDAQGYKIGDTQVSDFVYPSWFEGFRKPNSAKFDHRSLIDEPFKLLAGGYAVRLDIPSGLGWYQVDGAETREPGRYRRRAAVGSRRERRMTTKKQWLKSAPSRKDSSGG